MLDMTPPIRTDYLQPSEEFTEPPPDGQKWYCVHCGKDLFGVFYDGQLHIKYQDRHVFVHGVIRCRCRFCANESVIDTSVANMMVTMVHSEDDGYLERLLKMSVDASTAAMKLAGEHDIDLREVKGTGKDGRILKGDVEALIQT